MMRRSECVINAAEKEPIVLLPPPPPLEDRLLGAEAGAQEGCRRGRVRCCNTRFDGAAAAAAAAALQQLALAPATRASAEFPR